MSDDLMRKVIEATGTYSVSICRGDADLAPPTYLLEAWEAVRIRLREQRDEIAEWRRATTHDEPKSAAAGFKSVERTMDMLRADARRAEAATQGGRDGRMDRLDAMYAALSTSVVLAMIDALEAAKAMRDSVLPIDERGIKFDAAIARLEQEQRR